MAMPSRPAQRGQPPSRTAPPHPDLFKHKREANAIAADTFDAYRAALLRSASLRDQLISLPSDVVSQMSASEFLDVVHRMEKDISQDIFAVISKVVGASVGPIKHQSRGVPIPGATP